MFPYSCQRAIVIVIGVMSAFRCYSSVAAFLCTQKTLPSRCQHAVSVVRFNNCLQPLKSSNSEDEIFYDDFSGLSIGEDASSSSLDVEPLPTFDNAENAQFDVPSDSQLPTFDDEENNNELPQKDLISIPLPKTNAADDLTGSTLREFSFGPDILLSSYAGSLGFNQVTDWQYYSVDEYSGDKSPRSPNPLDPNQPARTRTSSGGVVRVFRGELLGGRSLGSKLRSRGVDARVWIKEYSGEEAIRLARAEKRGLGKLQSSWLKNYVQTSNKSELLDRMEDGEWLELAQRRYVDGLTDTPTTKDDENLITFLELLSNRKAQFSALLGEMNLNDYYDDETTDPNEFYKELGVKPPQPGSVWLVFDYHGLSTAASYAVPALIQRSKLPPKRGPFGGIIEPPPLPPFTERSRYMVQGVLKGMLGAVATAHDGGIVHRSIGRISFILSSVGQDKLEATSPYAVVVSRLRVILSDWGFSASVEEAAREKELGERSKMLGIPAIGSYEDQRAMDDRIKVAAEEFAKAEDLYALGFVFLAMLFTTLAEPETLTAPLPAADDDTWQRLFSEIFDKDMEAFRDYCDSEEVWESVVELLDRDEGAGWDLLGSLMLARERLSDWYREERDESELVSARSLLSHPFFQMKAL